MARRTRIFTKERGQVRSRWWAPQARRRSEQDATHRLVTFSTGSGGRRRALKAKRKPWATAVRSEDAGISSGSWDSTVAAEVKR